MEETKSNTTESNPSTAPTRQIKLKQIDGTLIETTVDANILVADLKKEIDKLTGVAPDKMRLIYKAKLLKDE